MAQPVKHDIEAMLDAVRDLVLSAGPRGANAAAVARALGAPSGSIYYRFRNRDELVAAAWLRAQRRFLDGLLPLIEQPTREDLRDAAQYVIAWCMDNPSDAALLVRHALRDLISATASPSRAPQVTTSNLLLREQLHRAADAVSLPIEEVLLVVVDLPYAVVRRRLVPGSTVQVGDVRAVRRAATCLLGLGE